MSYRLKLTTTGCNPAQTLKKTISNLQKIYEENKIRNLVSIISTSNMQSTEIKAHFLFFDLIKRIFLGQTFAIQKFLSLQSNPQKNTHIFALKISLRDFIPFDFLNFLLSIN